MMGYKLETTALISIDNYNAFRIRCIMLILEIIKNQLLKMVSIVVVTLLAFVFSSSAMTSSLE
jgi:hypothetical protein